MKVAPNLEQIDIAADFGQMLLIRRFEEASARLYTQGKIRGFLHLYIGEEAIAVGSIAVLQGDDYVVSSYRDHGHALARGMEPSVVMAELCGKATGSSGGRGCSMHLFDASRRFMGGYAIVGGQIPIAVGLAFAIKYKRENQVVLCFFGDGAVGEGAFHESMNLAALWKLPILFFLENNLYGMGSRVEQMHSSGRDLYLAAEPYGIPAAQIDGMDLLAVRDATTEAVNRVRSGSGPVFLEAMTYRFRGHSMSDPATYRDITESEDWKQKDPLERFKGLLLEEGHMNLGEIELLESEAMAAVEEAVRFADASPEPDIASLSDHVYA